MNTNVLQMHTKIYRLCDFSQTDEKLEQLLVHEYKNTNSDIVTVSPT